MLKSFDPTPLMQLNYLTIDGQEVSWSKTEAALKVFLLDDCGPDIAITKKNGDQRLECRLTKSGDFAITEAKGVRTYLKPRSRCTVSTPDGTQVVNTIIDLDARMDQVKRIEMMEEFLTDTVI
tara:strand:- start:193 stop:561 length:369 start_codon:yes stop_codon:yes gene_type:complete